MTLNPYVGLDYAFQEALANNPDILNTAGLVTDNTVVWFDFYINSAIGQDSFDGLTPSTPKKTIQGAFDAAQKKIFTGLFVRFNLADGTYTIDEFPHPFAQSSLELPPLRGVRFAELLGSSADNVTIVNNINSGATPNALVRANFNNTNWRVKNIRFQYSGAHSLTTIPDTGMVHCSENSSLIFSTCIIDLIEGTNSVFYYNRRGFLTLDGLIRFNTPNPVVQENINGSLFQGAYGSYCRSVTSDLDFQNNIIEFQDRFLNIAFDTSYDAIFSTTINAGNVTTVNTPIILFSNGRHEQLGGEIIPPQFQPASERDVDTSSSYKKGLGYDNATSGLTADFVHTAIDEVVAGGHINGPFADDTAAAGGGVAIGQLYYTATGEARVRLV